MIYYGNPERVSMPSRDGAQASRPSAKPAGSPRDYYRNPERVSEQQAMTQRTARVAGEIRDVLGDIVARQEIKDPRVRIAGIITFTHVRVSGDLRQATAFFTVHGMDDESLERVRQGLTSAVGYLRRRIADRLRLRSTPSLAFEVDRVFEEEEHIDALLKEVGAQRGEEGTEGNGGGSDDEDEGTD
jgi:ribosome-binding factor A